MSPKDLKDLVKLLRSQGITHYKTNEVELNLTPDVAKRTRRKRKTTTEEEQEIKHKLEELTSVMKLSDDDLVERLWPMPKDEVETQ